MGFHVYRLLNFTIILLPANTTSIVQPLDQGIVAAFKAHYRSQLVQFVIRTLNNSPDLTLQQVKIDAHSAVWWGQHATKALTQATISNCWWKAGILGRTRCQRLHPVQSDAAMHVQAVSIRQRRRQSWTPQKTW
jgi:hypothetical protein